MNGGDQTSDRNITGDPDQPADAMIAPSLLADVPAVFSPPASLSVHQSLAYRWRIRITAVLLLTTWIGVLYSPPIVKSGSLIAVFADYFGWMVFGGGIVLRLWSISNIGGRKSQELVNHGPYALCRNPLYVGTFLLMLSQAFLLKSLTFLSATIALFIFYHLCVVPVEERVLLSRFGEAFTTYCETVPRWWPRRVTVQLPQVTVTPGPLRAELRQTVWWLALPLLCATTAYLQNHPDWPRFFRLP
jgi:protein-S-isoprenylcysteine O-methyltransferase Ste14